MTPDDRRLTIDWTTLRAVIMDMDGVLWRGSEGLPGVSDLFAFLRDRGVAVALATNNSSKTARDYVSRLAGLGVESISERQVITSATATVDHLRATYPQGARVHVLGGSGLKQAITAAGFVVVSVALDGVPVRAVVAGIDFDLTYEKLKQATFSLRAGADFIGTNADASFPVPEGLAPGAGSILALLSTASGRQPLIIGKPGAPIFLSALAAVGTRPDETLMIGDRLDTDIAGAQAVGMRAALVLTGVTTTYDLERTTLAPDGVYDDLPALMAAWRAAT